MALCRFWLQGHCRFGDRCKFEHTNAQLAPVSTNNRYGAFQSPDTRNNNYQNNSRGNTGNYNDRRNDGYQGDNSRSNAGYSNRAPQERLPYSLDKEAIVLDLTSEKPQWILSAYGPGRHAPAQLFGGSVREQSFEEMRLIHYAAVAIGNPQKAVQDAENLFQASEQQMQTVVNNLDGAIEYLIKAENEHPNRIDICKESQNAGAGAQSGVFSKVVQPERTANPFGAPSQPAASPFGTPSVPVTGAFGQPSGLGQKPSPFGGGSSAFGAPSVPAGAFGQPSALGQKPSPFAAASSAFGAPSLPAAAPSPFGTLSLPANTGAFGQPSALGRNPNPFGRPPAATSNQLAAPFSGFQGPATGFGAPSQPTAATQPNPFGTAPGQAPNPFASSRAQPNPFNNGVAAPFGVSSPAKNAFSAPTSQQPGPKPSSTFGAASQSANSTPFGAPSVGFAANPFAVKQNDLSKELVPFGNATQTINGVRKQPASGEAPTINLTANGEQPPLASYAKKDASGRLTMFKGKRVVYKDEVPGTMDRDGHWAKIWFPEGAPGPMKGTEMEEKDYDDSIKDIYLAALAAGGFSDGKIPLVPPKKEWSRWDF